MYYFSNLFFGIEIYMFRRGISLHHQESSTVYTAIGICHTGYVDCLLAGSESILIPHLVGFIIRICHHARSSECQNTLHTYLRKLNECVGEQSAERNI